MGRKKLLCSSKKRTMTISQKYREKDPIRLIEHAYALPPSARPNHFRLMKLRLKLKGNRVDHIIEPTDESPRIYSNFSSSKHELHIAQQVVVPFAQRVVIENVKILSIVRKIKNTPSNIIAEVVQESDKLKSNSMAFSRQNYSVLKESGKPHNSAKIAVDDGKLKSNLLVFSKQNSVVLDKTTSEKHVESGKLNLNSIPFTRKNSALLDKTASFLKESEKPNISAEIAVESGKVKLNSMPIPRQNSAVLHKTASFLKESEKPWEDLEKIVNDQIKIIPKVPYESEPQNLRCFLSFCESQIVKMEEEKNIAKVPKSPQNETSAQIVDLVDQFENESLPLQETQDEMMIPLTRDISSSEESECSGSIHYCNDSSEESECSSSEVFAKKSKPIIAECEVEQKISSHRDRSSEGSECSVSEIFVKKSKPITADSEVKKNILSYSDRCLKESEYSDSIHYCNDSSEESECSGSEVFAKKSKPIIADCEVPQKISSYQERLIGIKDKRKLYNRYDKLAMVGVEKQVANNLLKEKKDNTQKLNENFKITENRKQAPKIDSKIQITIAEEKLNNLLLDNLLLEKRLKERICEPNLEKTNQDFTISDEAEIQRTKPTFTRVPPFSENLRQSTNHPSQNFKIIENIKQASKPENMIIYKNKIQIATAQGKLNNLLSERIKKQMSLSKRTTYEPDLKKSNQNPIISKESEIRSNRTIFIPASNISENLYNKSEKSLSSEFNGLQCRFCKFTHQDIELMAHHYFLKHVNTCTSEYYIEKNDKYSCQLCNLNFCSVIYLKVHCVKKHFNELFSKDTYICWFCRSATSNIFGIIQHYRSRHENIFKLINYRCADCRKLFPSEAHIQIHFILNRSKCKKEECTCTYCPKLRTSLPEFQIHYLRCHSDMVNQLKDQSNTQDKQPINKDAGKIENMDVEIKTELDMDIIDKVVKNESEPEQFEMEVTEERSISELDDIIKVSDLRESLKIEFVNVDVNKDY